MSNPWKTYRVSFCVHDYYTVELKARSECEAIAKAQDLYSRENEEVFEFDFTRGGTDEWDAEAIS